MLGTPLIKGAQEAVDLVPKKSTDSDSTHAKTQRL
jgi:hypothetical protein